MDIDEIIATAQFSVYGIVDHPLGLTRHGRHVATGYDPSITLEYTSPLYPSYPNEMLAPRNFWVLSAPSRTAGIHEGDSILDMMIQEQVQPVRNPFLWQGTLNIAGTLFSGAIRYYAAPLKMAGFHLLSEESFLGGRAYGPSCDELIELLEGLQVLNRRDDVVRQYQQG
jgi:hypothetical protein